MMKTLKLIALTLVCVLCLNLGMAFAEVDFANYTEDLNAWTSADVLNYLKECGLINDAYYTLDLSVNDLNAMSAKSGFLHMDMDGMQAYLIIIQLDDESEQGANILDFVREYQIISPDGDSENGIQVDALVGNICFYYTDSLNDEIITGMTQAILNLCAHYGVEPDFIVEE